MTLETKILENGEPIEEYFDKYFNSQDLTAELVSIPPEAIDSFCEKIPQIPGEQFLLTCRFNSREDLLDYQVLLKLYAWIWLSPIRLSIRENFNTWWDPVIINVFGNEKNCGVWKIRTFENTPLRSIAFTFPKVLHISEVDRYNILTEDLIKARFSAALLDAKF